MVIQFVRITTTLAHEEVCRIMAAASWRSERRAFVRCRV